MKIFEPVRMYASPGLGQAEGADLLPGREGREVLPLLLLGAEGHDRVQGQHVGAEDRAGRGARGAEILGAHGPGEEAHAHAAVLLRHGNAHQVHLGDLAHALPREDERLIHRPSVGRQLLVTGDYGGRQREAGAKADEQHRVSARQATLGAEDIQSQRHGGRRGVAVPVDGHDDLLRREPEPLGGGLDDAEVRLVHDEQVHLRRRDTGFGQRLFGDRRDALHRQAKELPTGHPDAVVVSRHGLGRRTPTRAAGGLRQQVAVFAAVHHDKGPQAEPRLARRHQHRPGAVAEEHAGRAVGPVGDAREGVGADDQDIAVGAVLDELSRGSQRRDEARAPEQEVEGGGVLCAEISLDEAGRCREEHVRRDGGHNDEAHILSAGARVRETRLRGPGGQVRGRFLGGGQVPRPNAGALDDPLVTGLQLGAGFKLGVGEDALGEVGAQPHQAR